MPGVPLDSSDFTSIDPASSNPAFPVNPSAACRASAAVSNSSHRARIDRGRERPGSGGTTKPGRTHAPRARDPSRTGAGIALESPPEWDDQTDRDSDCDADSEREP